MSMLLLRAGNRESLSQAVFTSDPGLGLLLPYADVAPDFRLTSCPSSNVFPLFVSILVDAYQ